MKGATPGIVDVYLDDVKKATLDLVASPAVYQVTLWSSGDSHQHHPPYGPGPEHRSA